MKVLALDISTRVGIAVGEAGGNPTAWAEVLGKKGDDDRLFSQALVLMSRLIEAHRPDLIAYEGAVGGDRTSHYLVGIIACFRGCAANRGVPLVACNIGAIRSHFIGKHITSAQYKHLPKTKAKAVARAEAKLAVQNRVKMLGWGITGEDECDACAVWDFACAKSGAQVKPGGGLFHGS